MEVSLKMNISDNKVINTLVKLGCLIFFIIGLFTVDTVLFATFQIVWVINDILYPIKMKKWEVIATDIIIPFIWVLFCFILFNNNILGLFVLFTIVWFIINNLIFNNPHEI